MDERLKDIRASNEAPDILSALPVGTALRGGRYMLERVLGKGGFGITYLAEDRQSGGAFEEREVVVKELFISSGETLNCVREGNTVHPTGSIGHQFPDFIEKFDKEAKMLHRYREVPGVVKVIDLFRENETAYFVMSYIKGQTLQAMIVNEGVLSLDRTRVILGSLVKTLTYLHRDRVLHRDIKPENIMVTASDAVYLIDFGLAKEFISGKTRLDTGMHTPRYGAPEQKMNRSVSGSVSPDIYSLAATVYSMLTGKYPQTTDERQYDGYMSVSAVVPGLPSHVDAAVTRGMKFRHEERQPSVTAFYDDFAGSASVSNGDEPKPLDDVTFVDRQASDDRPQPSDNTRVSSNSTNNGSGYSRVGSGQKRRVSKVKKKKDLGPVLVLLLFLFVGIIGGVVYIVKEQKQKERARQEQAEAVAQAKQEKAKQEKAKKEKARKAQARKNRARKEKAKKRQAAQAVREEQARKEKARKEKEEADKVFVKVETQPQPKGGMRAFYKFVGDNLTYPSQARLMGIEGRVTIAFVVGKDGKLTDVKVLKGIGAGCDEEAVRVIKSVPAWSPGTQGGKPVRVRMVIPISFKLG